MIATFAMTMQKGGTVADAEKASGISHVTAYRQMKTPGSAINKALAELGVAGGKIPSVKELARDAQRALKDFEFFREFFFARSTAPWAVEAAYKIIELLESERKEYLVVNIAPGIGKSTFFTHDLPAWILCRDRAKSVMIGSASQNLANGYVNRLRVSFERTIAPKADSDLVTLKLAKDALSTMPMSYGRFRPVSGQGQWSRSQFDVAQPNGVIRGEKEASVAAFGMDAGYLGGRYDFVIWDDLVTNATMATEASREKLISDWESQAETRLEPKGLLILQGQRLGPNDLYRYALNLKEATEIDVTKPDTVEARKYHHIIYKAHYDEKCMAKEHPENHAINAKAYPEGCLLDPYRLEWRELANMKLNREGKYRTVFQQEDIPVGDTLVNKLWIDGGIDPITQGLFVGCWDDDRSAGIIPPGLEGTCVITADPSPTQFWAVCWWIYNPRTKYQHLIDMRREPMTASDFLDFNPQTGLYTGLLEMWWQEARAQGRPVTHLIVEANAAQRFMLQYNHFRNWASERRVLITSHTTARNKSDPNFGIQTIAPYYKFGQVRLPGNRYDGSRQLVSQLVKEVTEWPNGATDDCVMAHWFLVWNAQNLFRDVTLEPPRFTDVPSWAAEMGF